MFDKPVKIWKVSYYRGSFCPLSLVTYCFRNHCSHIPQYFLVSKTSIHSGEVVCSGLLPLVQNHIVLDFKENFVATFDDPTTSAVVTLKENIIVLLKESHDNLQRSAKLLRC